MTAVERVLHLAGELPNVTTARHFVRDVLLHADLAELVDDAQLATSELVANAIRHARTDLTLAISVDTVVTISVRDGDPELRRPLPPRAADHAEGGRGLQIVAAVSADWGVSIADGGKIVWFSLARPDGRSGDADVVGIRSGGLTGRRNRPDPHDGGQLVLRAGRRSAN